MINLKNYYNLIENYEKKNHKNSTSNKKGVVYTNRKIARKMVAMLNPKINETIKDPCCGAGVFVVATLEHIVNKYNPTKAEMKNYVENNLFFSDIDLEALDFIENLINTFLGDNYCLADVELNIKYENSLTDWYVHYDCIICNPPYLILKYMRHHDREIITSFFETCKKGNIDMYYAFMELCLIISSRSCLITPNSYFINNSASILRKKLISSISSIRDFKEDKQFESASTYTAIILLDKNTNDTFEYAKYNEPSKTMHKSRLYSEKWYFDAPINNIKYTPNNSTTLGDIADIYSRVQTSSDKLFTVNTKICEDGYYFKEYKGVKYPIEKRACVSLKKLNKYFGVKNVQDQAIIFPYKNTNVILEELELLKKFPKTYEYFLAIKDLLTNRNKGNISKYDNWYAYGKKQNINVNFSQKACIILPNIYLEGNLMSEVITSPFRFLHSSGFVIIPKKGQTNLVKQIFLDKNLENYLNDYCIKLPGTKNTRYNSITKALLKNHVIHINEPANNIVNTSNHIDHQL